MTSEPVDLVALQEQVEEVLRAEYAAEFEKLRRLEHEHALRTAGWNAILHRIMEHYSGPLTLADNAHLDQFLQRLDVIVRMGLDFEVLTKAIESDEIVKKQWDSLCMAMRLTGMDNSASDSDIR